MIVQEKVLMSANNPLRQLSTRRLLALCRKESYQIVRDPSSILIAFILPVVLLFIFGYGINLDTNRVRLGLLQQDNGADAQNFAAALMGSPSLEIIQSTSRPALEQQLRRGAIRGMVVIDPDFSASLQHNQQKKPLQLQAQSPSYYPLPLQSLPQPQVQPQPRLQAAASIQVLTDGSEPNTANFLGSYVQGALQIWQVQRARDLGLPAPQLTTLEPRYWFNPGTISRNYLVPGSISVIMTVIGALLTSLVVAREWERGTMEALLSTSVTRTELLLSKILPYYVLGMVAMLLCVLVATQLMHIPFRGSLWMLFIISSLFLGSGLGLGLFLSSVTRNQFVAAQAALTAAFLPATMLSGFVFEIASMPTAIQAISTLVPARYFVNALQTLFQAGDVWPVLLENTLYLLLSAIFWLGLTALKTPRRLDGN